MDGSIFTVRAHPCPGCWRITYQPGHCRLCQKGAVTPS